MRKCLLFDADDTLWENNIHFERAIREFLELLQPVAPDPRAVKALLCEVEREFIPQGGYGSRNFIRALRETFRRLYSQSDGAAYLRAIGEIGDRLLNHPIELLPGVAATLQELQSGHRLILFTKGDAQEQSGKLERSGLRALFERIEIAGEKDASAYRRLIDRHSLCEDSTFMVGNSPRSDVLPALAAGLWAIFVPHAHTWELEDHPLPIHPRLLQARSFAALPLMLSEWAPPLY
jgi:putative hydrolase of the HAD superfamily